MELYTWVPGYALGYVPQKGVNKNLETVRQSFLAAFLTWICMQNTLTVTKAE